MIRPLVLLLASGCLYLPDGALDDRLDQDGDGYAGFGGPDCDDADPDVHPTAWDEPYDDVDADCAGDSDHDRDDDGHDRLASGGDDCDDDDPYVHPDADDLPYDGVDADCDGADDFDIDGDGFNPLAFGGLDCDDRDALVHPDADDPPYDGLDADCDGWSDFDADRDGLDHLDHGGTDCDDGDPGVGAATERHADADADGYGDPQTTEVVCPDVPGFVADGTDCDDTNDSLHPNATEVFYDGVDQDCAGDNDFDADGDGFVSADYAGDDCDDSDAAVSPDADEVWRDGVDRDCNGKLWTEHPFADEAWATLVAEQPPWEQGDPVWLSVAAGDLDLDGTAEVVAGFPTGDETPPELVMFELTGPGTLYAVDRHDGGRLFGTAVAIVGDQNGDGVDDIATVTAEGTSEGMVHVVAGSPSGFGNEAALLVGPVWNEGEATLAPADLDGDGWGDLVVGGPADHDDSSGDVWLLQGPIRGGRHELVSLAARWNTPDPSILRAGNAVTASDLDGDGLDEVLVGACRCRYPAFSEPVQDPGGGRVFVLPPADGADHDLMTDFEALFEGAGPLVDAGAAVATADVDGDGLPEVVIGAPGSSEGALYTGAVLIAELPAPGAVVDLGVGAAARINGEWPFGRVGNPLTAADIDGDGTEDLVFGEEIGFGTESTRRAAYVMLGPIAGTRSTSDANLYLAGPDYVTGLASPGDLDLDGMDDVVVRTVMVDNSIYVVSPGEL